MLDNGKIKNLSTLAFCVFAKRVYVAWSTGETIAPIEENKLESVLFDTLSPLLHTQKFDRIIIPAGPAPFTQLRILRAVQLGLSTGLNCEPVMVTIFDVLFRSANLETGTCLLETKRGDYFFQTRLDGVAVDEGITQNPLHFSPPIISDAPQRSTVEITRNLARTMVEKNLTPCTELIYSITLPY